MTALAGILNQSMTEAVMDLYLQAMDDVTDEQFFPAVARAVKESTFFPKPAELRNFAGVGPAAQATTQNAEARAAWDVLMKFVSRNVWTNPHGAVCADNAEQLDQRITDSVRRSGGWETYVRMNSTDFPFIQKRFFDEYHAWSSVQRVDLGKLLSSPQMKALVAKAKLP